MKLRMLPKQLAFAACKAKWAGARGGVGSGKTIGVVYYVLNRLRDYPKHSCFVVGADFEQLRRGFFESTRNVLEGLHMEDGRDFRYRESPSPMLLFLRGRSKGARIRALSAEQAERIRSVEIQTLICEEPPTWKAGGGETVFSVLGGRLRHSQRTATLYPEMQPQGRMTFNPPAVGTWIHNLVQNVWPALGFPCWKMSVRENTIMTDLEGFIGNVKMSTPEDRWPVEIDGEWATTGGGVYRYFDASIHGGPPPAGLPPKVLDRSKPLLWCLDFNVGWMASVVAQAHIQTLKSLGWIHDGQRPPYESIGSSVADWQRRIFYVLDELFLPDCGTEDVVAEFIRRHGDHARYAGVVLYGDASGGGRSQQLSSTASARSNWEILVQRLRAAGINVTMRVQSQNPAPLDRINAMNLQFRQPSGYGVLVDTIACPELVLDWFQVRFKPGTNDIDKGDTSEAGKKRTHLSDAVGYMIWVERQLEKDPHSVKWSMVR